jgi:hypothetical protein
MTLGIAFQFKRPINAGDGESSRSKLLYGQWTTADGTDVLFDRKYRPKWCRKPDGTVTAADPLGWIDNIVRVSWFYTDRASLSERKQTNAKIVAEWRSSGCRP